MTLTWTDKPDRVGEYWRRSDIKSVAAYRILILDASKAANSYEYSFISLLPDSGNVTSENVPKAKEFSQEFIDLHNRLSRAIDERDELRKENKLRQDICDELQKQCGSLKEQLHGIGVQEFLSMKYENEKLRTEVERLRADYEVAFKASDLFRVEGNNLREEIRRLKSELAAKQPPVAAKCSKCGQTPNGQGGEYPCPECGLPTLHDPKEPGQSDMVAENNARRTAKHDSGDDQTHCASLAFDSGWNSAKRFFDKPTLTPELVKALKEWQQWYLTVNLPSIPNVNETF